MSTIEIFITLFFLSWFLLLLAIMEQGESKKKGKVLKKSSFSPKGSYRKGGGSKKSPIENKALELVKQLTDATSDLSTINRGESIKKSSFISALMENEVWLVLLRSAVGHGTEPTLKKLLITASVYAGATFWVFLYSPKMGISLSIAVLILVYLALTATLFAYSINSTQRAKAEYIKFLKQFTILYLNEKSLYATVVRLKTTLEENGRNKKALELLKTFITYTELNTPKEACINVLKGSYKEEASINQFWHIILIAETSNKDYKKSVRHKPSFMEKNNNYAMDVSKAGIISTAFYLVLMLIVPIVIAKGLGSLEGLEGVNTHFIGTILRAFYLVVVMLASLFAYKSAERFRPEVVERKWGVL